MKARRKMLTILTGLLLLMLVQAVPALADTTLDSATVGSQAGAASAGKTGYWPKTAELVVSLQSTYVQVSWPLPSPLPSGSEYRLEIDGPGTSDWAGSIYVQLTYANFGPAESGRHRVVVTLVESSTGRPLDSLRTTFIWP